MESFSSVVPIWKLLRHYHWKWLTKIMRRCLKSEATRLETTCFVISVTVLIVFCFLMWHFDWISLHRFSNIHLFNVLFKFKWKYFVCIIHVRMSTFFKERYNNSYAVWNPFCFQVHGRKHLFVVFVLFQLMHLTSVLLLLQ